MRILLLATAALLSSAVVSAQHAQPAVQRGPSVDVVRPPLLPHAVASFGAATCDGFLYVFGGHVGRAHQHSRENLVGSFNRLSLKELSWEALPDGPPLQGTTLVAGPNGELLRVGGLDARNAQGAEEDLHSVATVELFDSKTRRWEEFAALPEPRSSHDAIVVDGKLYVVGGWHLSGKEEPVWHKTALVCDLTEEPRKWAALPPPPFVRRACAVARFGSQVAVVGGMNEDGTTSEVSVFDPKSGEWRAGPDLPGQGFGAAAIGVGEALFATAMDGRVFRLGQGAKNWESVTNLAMPRFFHRLSVTPDKSQLIALGGASRSGHMRHVEFAPLAKGNPHRMHEWVVPYSGHATYRSALVLQSDTIFVFGGNRGDSGKRFAAEQFVKESHALSLVGMGVRRLGELPNARQSMVGVSWGRKANETLLLGGIGPDGDSATVRASSASFSFDPRSGEVSVASALPSPRTQFQAVNHDDKVWVFGGTDFRPDDSGAGESNYPLDVLVYDTKADNPRFESAGVTLPSPRRSFGAAVIGNKAYLVGGLAKGFDAAEHCDVFDFDTRKWSRMPAPPKSWVSPQVGAIGNRLYVACGGTMSGQRFSEDRTVYSFDEKSGWQPLIGELPFGTRHVQMRVLRDRLLFLDMREPGSVTIRMVRPKLAATVIEAGFGH